MAVDIQHLDVPELDWSPAGQRQSLDALRCYVEMSAQNSLAWYALKKRSTSRWSRGLRAAAVVLTTIGGLIPLVGATGIVGSFKAGERMIEFGQLGYVALALAGACIGLDKYFGLSSGWMRYITTGMSIHQAREDFRLEWALLSASLGGAPPTSTQLAQFLTMVKAFSQKVTGLVQSETQAWITEFQANLAELEKQAKTQMDGSRPGALDLTVTNGTQAESGFCVTLDGNEVGTVVGTKWQISHVSPGNHQVGVEATVNGRAVRDSIMIPVEPGRIEKVQLTLQ